MAASYSPATLAKYRKALLDFSVFAAGQGLPTSLPIAPRSLALYVAHLSLANLSPAYIKSLVAALSWHHKINDMADPGQFMFIKRAVKGILPLKDAPLELLPLDRNILHDLLDLAPNVCQAGFETTLIKALLLTSYHCCLRAGEAVVSGHDLHTIKIEDVSVNFDEFSINITLKSYKFSNGQKSLSIKGAEVREHCPVIALLEYLKIRPSTKGCMFVNAQGVAINRNYFADKIKQLVARSGRDPTRFNTHSLRSGRASDLAKAGVPDAIIKETGRWNSDAFQKYIKFAAFSLPL